jgi:uncharacterized protein
MVAVGTVSELRRYPIKSMLGERIEASEVTERGLAGDRAYALMDAETGKVVSAKRPRLWGRMFEFRASYRTAPVAGASTPVTVTLPTGERLTTDGPDIDRVLSDALGRKVSLLNTTDDFLTYEEVWVEEKQADPYGPVVGSEGTDRLIENPVSVGAPRGTFFDYSAIHLVTNATLRALRSAHAAGDFDVRRFRPNIVIDVAGDGFVEDEWIERTLRIGEAVRLEVLVPTPRCVMTTLPQEELPKDSNILRTAARTNRRPFGPFGEQACVGVYADVLAGGSIAVGDEIHVEPA